MSGSTALLVVLSIVGYLLLRHRCHRTRFRWDALEWQQNLFESTAVGLGLFAIVRLASPLTTPLATRGGVPIAPATALVSTNVPLPFASSVIGALALGLVVAWLANRRWNREQSLALAITRHGGSMRTLLHDALRSERPVMLSMANRKVYVGLVFTPPSLHKTSHVVIFPTLSGARGNEDLAIRWTTDYSPAYIDMMSRLAAGEELKTSPSHFQLVLPLELVHSATYFDKELYDRHFAPQDD